MLSAWPPIIMTLAFSLITVVVLIAIIVGGFKKKSLLGLVLRSSNSERKNLAIATFASRTVTSLVIVIFIGVIIACTVIIISSDRLAGFLDQTKGMNQVIYNE